MRQQYVAVKDGKLVDRPQMAKGYEFAKDQFVMFSPEELKELEEKTSVAIDISEFVPLDSVESHLFRRDLSAGAGERRRQTVFSAGDCAAQIRPVRGGALDFSGKEHVVVIRPFGDGLALHQLHFQGELRSIKDLAIESAPVTDAELKLATALIDQLSVKKFDPSEFTDEFKSRVEAAIKRKVQGKEVSLTAAPSPKRSGNVVDLMSALRPASAANRQARHRAARPSERRQRRHARRRADEIPGTGAAATNPACRT